MNNKGTGPVGLVLSGGGGKGAYQIGVWYALKEYGIDKMITHVAGTSVGALNACLFTMGDYDHAEDVWSSLAIDDVLTFDQVKATAWATKLREQGLLGTLSESTLRLFSKNRSDGFFSREKLGQLIEYEVDFSALRNSQIQTYATCYDKSTMSAAYFNLKKYKANTIKEILLASSAIPVVFDSHSVQKHEYYDGGIVDNTPISPLYNEGVRDFIVVHLSQSSLVDRSKFLDSRFIEIVPQQDMGNLFSGTLNFSQRTIRSRMEAGYDDTKALLGSLRGNHLFEDQSIPLQGETMAIVPYANRDKVVSSANRERVESSLQNLYFDFEQNREDYLFEDGRTAYPGLVSQLKAIKKRFGSAFLPHLSSEDDILDNFINIFFPSDYPRDFYVSNVSLEQSTRLLMFRPTVTTPSLGRVLPSGTTIFIQCRIWDDSKDPDNGVLQARRIIACPDSPPRDFEVPLRGVVISGADKVYPLRNRSSNVLTQEFIEKIPLISEKTKSNTQLWSEYLNWREKLLQRQLKGLRYFEREIFDGDKLRFSVISESNESFRDQQRILRSNELYAYDLSYSKDQLRFAYDEDQWINSNEGVELGVFNGFQDTGRQLPEGVSVPWKDPYTAVVVYQLPDELLARIASTDAESEQAELRRDFLDKLPEQGFLSLSIVGDLVLLQRQRKELQKLREESGSAPFLSSYLFDISKAHVPTALVEIRDDEWMHSNLNEDQRAAVRKMLSVRDLCLIQGPPGTGKTTMIAEATWQFINQGKRVLVVSQASLAVNNVLERLPRVPGTRAIRLSKRERRNEREHPYSKSNALKTYFNSIAESCRENFLNVWEKNEKQLIHFKKLKTNFEYLLRDYEEICSLESIHRAKRLELDSKRKQVLGQKFQYDQKNALPKKELEEFLQFLEERDASTTSIPDLLEPAFFKTLILPIQGLVQKGFNPNVFSPHYVEGIPSQKEKASIEVFSAWKRLYHLRMQVAQDLQAFRESSTTLHLKTSLYTEFLDRDNTLNEALFSGDGYLIEPLESLYEVLNQSEMLLDDAKNKLIQKTQQLLGQMGQSDVYTHQLISLDNKLFATDSELKECQRNKTSKEQKMKDLCAEYMGKANTPPIFDSEEVTRIQDSLKADISRIETEVALSDSVEKDWKPFLLEWTKRLANADLTNEQVQGFESTYVKNCNVVGVTCTESRRTLEDNEHYTFDVVIIDEVSKATPTEIIMPMMLAETAILVGDHRQLPPLFREHESSFEEVVDESEEQSEDTITFTREDFDRYKALVTASMFKEHFENAPDAIKSTLLTQYRMHPKIMGVVNKFYDNCLKCGLADPDAKDPASDKSSHRMHGLSLQGVNHLNYIDEDKPVIWIDSSTNPLGEKYYEDRDQGTSKYNELESLLIAKVLIDLEQACQKQGYGLGGKPKKEVGVITFYNRQVHSIRDSMQALKKAQSIEFKAISVDINTVDRYQGQERQIVIVSLVRNPESQYLSKRANTARYERINVAFSRAQELLVILGAMDIFNNYQVKLPFFNQKGEREVPVYKQIISEIQLVGGVVHPRDVLSREMYGRFSKPRNGAKKNYNYKRNHSAWK